MVSRVWKLENEIFHNWEQQSQPHGFTWHPTPCWRCERREQTALAQVPEESIVQKITNLWNLPPHCLQLQTTWNIGQNFWQDCVCNLQIWPRAASRGRLSWRKFFMASAGIVPRLGHDRFSQNLVSSSFICDCFFWRYSPSLWINKATLLSGSKTLQ